MVNESFTFEERNFYNPKGIDRHGMQRTVPMQVLVLGLPRTGTASMSAALRMLGYNDTYHMLNCIENIPDNDIWQEAINAKWHGKGKPFGRKEFDQVLGHCMALTDMPCIAFPEELLEAYPDAKVVLTTREIDGWCKSISSTIGAKMTSPLTHFLMRIDPDFLGRWLGMAIDLWTCFFGALSVDETMLKKKFIDHHELVRKLVPPENLLEWRPGDGWEPLCKFLGKEIPAESYPRVNETAKFDENFKIIFKGRIKTAAGKFLKLAVPIAVVGVAAYTARVRGMI